MNAKVIIPIIFSTMLLSGNAYAKPPKEPKIDDVNVVNVPDVNVVNVPDVNVANSNLEPVFVLPMRTPHSQSVSLPLNNGDTSFDFEVPMGSTWVVENISYRFEPSVGNECHSGSDMGILYMRIRAVEDNLIVTSAHLPTPSVDGGAVTENREITFYASRAGMSAFVQVIPRASPPGPLFCGGSGRVTLIGYLLPAAP